MDSRNYWTRRRFTRRRTLQSAGLTSAGLAALALVGCGGDDDDDDGGGGGGAATSTTRPVETAAPPQAKSGGTLHNTSLPALTYQHVDPHANRFVVNYTGYTHSMLAVLDDSASDSTAWETAPDAAKDWETPDDTTVIFNLEDGLKFHNLPPAQGRAATAEDVKFSLERIGMAVPQFFRQNDFKKFGMTVEATDEKTVTIKFTKPMAPFFNRITIPGTVILPEEVGSTIIVDPSQKLSGTGPFMHDSYVADRSWSVVKNPAYFRSGQPYLDKIEGIGVSAGTEALFTQFKAKQIDAWTVGTLDQWNELKNLSGVRPDRRIGNQSTWLVFNTAKPPFDNPRVRYALSIATPRQEIIDVAHRGEEDGIMLGPGGLNPFLHGEDMTYSYADLKKRKGYRSGADAEADIAEAKQILNAAGFTEYSGRMRVTSQASAWPYGDTLSVLLQEAYAKLGFDLTLEPSPYSDTLVNLASKDYEIMWTPQYANGTDVDDYLDIYYAENGARNYSKWRNEAYFALVEKQATQTDREERAATVREMLAILEEDAPRYGVELYTNKFIQWDYLKGHHGSVNGTFAAQEWWLDK